MNSTIIQKTVLRLWIVTASIVSFVAGWAMLAQTPHPSQTTSRCLAAIQEQPSPGFRARSDAGPLHAAAWRAALDQSVCDAVHSATRPDLFDWRILMQTLAFTAMNTAVLLAAEGSDSVEPALQQTRALILHLEQRFSRFLPESELSQLNRSARKWHDVSADLMEILTLAADVLAARRVVCSTRQFCRHSNAQATTAA